MLRPSLWSCLSCSASSKRLRWVHASGWFVQHEQARARGERAGDFDPAAIGVGQRAETASFTRGTRRLPKRERISITRSRASISSRARHGFKRKIARDRAGTETAGAQPTSTLSITDRLGNSRMFWKVRASAGFQDAVRRLSPISSLPRRSEYVPDAAGVSPVMTLNRVDLPDPFGPITANTPPSGTVSVNAFSATRPPNRTAHPLHLQQRTCRDRLAGCHARQGDRGQAVDGHAGLRGLHGRVLLRRRSARLPCDGPG